MRESTKEKYECCGQTFNTKEEMEVHKGKMHMKSCCQQLDPIQPQTQTTYSLIF